MDKLWFAAGRIEVAGGIRRGKEEPHDIEIVATPETYDVFGYKNSIDQAMHELLSHGEIERGDPVTHARGENQIVVTAPFSEKYYRVKYKGERLDVFVCTPPASWGVIFLLRTGDEWFNQWIVKQGWPRGFYFKDGALWRHTDSKGRYIPHSQIKQHDHETCRLEKVPTPEEGDVFRALEVPWRPPERRVAAWQVRAGLGHQ